MPTDCREVQVFNLIWSVAIQNKVIKQYEVITTNKP